MTATPNRMPYKICPKCQTAAPMEAPQCLQCGRVYRTQFVARPTPIQPIQYPTQVFVPSVPNIGQGRKRVLLPFAIFLGTLLLVCIGIVVNGRRNQSSSVPSTADASSVPAPVRRFAGQESDTQGQDARLPTDEEISKNEQREQAAKEMAEQQTLTIAQMRKMVKNYKETGETLVYFGKPDVKLPGVPNTYPANIQFGAKDCETWLYFRKDGMLRIVFNSGRLVGFDTM